MIVGIDAMNLHSGGTVTHIIELLNASPFKDAHDVAVVIWGSESTLKRVTTSPRITKIVPAAATQGWVRRSLWQWQHLSAEARRHGCDVLFVPGGAYAGDFKPTVVMSQNLLAFDRLERRRYGLRDMRWKLEFLAHVQREAFRRAQGIIFLSDHARSTILTAIHSTQAMTTIVPHGIPERFKASAPSTQRAIETCSQAKPFRLLYISTIDMYKHPWNVVTAVAALRERTGWPLALDLVGSAYPPALRRLQSAIDRYDPQGAFVNYHNAVPYADINKMYNAADVGVFASTCENLPIALLETMASGLPVASSNRRPMTDVLGDAGAYFEPEDPASIENTVFTLITKPDLRVTLAQRAWQRAKTYAWEAAARDTLRFLRAVVDDHHGAQSN